MSVLNMFKLDSQVALVTVAGAGIGRAIAELFAKAGASVVVSDFGYLRVQKISIMTNPSQPITVDGEMIDTTSAFFEIVPASLQVISSYEQVILSQEKLIGLPSLMVIDNYEQKIEDIVLHFRIPVNLERTITQIFSEIGEQLLCLWHTLSNAAKILSETLIEAMIYLLWNIAKNIDEFFSSLGNVLQPNNPSSNIKNINLTVNYKIVHHICGRIRLQIPRLRQDADYANHLQSFIQSLNGVEAV